MSETLSFYTVIFEDINRFTNLTSVKSWTTTATSKEEAAQRFNYITPPYNVKRKIKNIVKF